MEMRTHPLLLAAALAAPATAFAHDFIAASKSASKYVAIQFKEDGKTLTMFYDMEALKSSREGDDPRCRAELFEFDARILKDTPANVMNVVLVRHPSRSRTSHPYKLFTRDAYSEGSWPNRTDFPASRGVQGSGGMISELREIPLPDYLASLSFGRSEGGALGADQVYALLVEQVPTDLSLEVVELASDWMVVKSADQKTGSPPECFRRRDLADPREIGSGTSLDATVPLYNLQRTDLKHVGEAKVAHYSARPSGRFLRARAKPLHQAEYRILLHDGKEIEIQGIISLDQEERETSQPERLFTRVTFAGPAPAIPAQVESPQTQTGAANPNPTDASTKIPPFKKPKRD